VGKPVQLGVAVQPGQLLQPRPLAHEAHVL
jgi:hypothetical protein